MGSQSSDPFQLLNLRKNVKYLTSIIKIYEGYCYGWLQWLMSNKFTLQFIKKNRVYIYKVVLVLPLLTEVPKIKMEWFLHMMWISLTQRVRTCNCLFEPFFIIDEHGLCKFSFPSIRIVCNQHFEVGFSGAWIFCWAGGCARVHPFQYYHRPEQRFFVQFHQYRVTLLTRNKDLIFCPL